MPVISVVIPVHGVERWLDQCLRSVLGDAGSPAGTGTEGPGPELEVIAVNDASPDGCADLLARAARADARLRVLTTQAPSGPGAARALGAKHATGEYLWFVDGDDELAPGALAAVTAALGRLRPDVLLTDYENLYPGGGRTPSGADLSGPELTTLARSPHLVFTTMTVWSKVFRREFWAGLPPFGPGIHEDIPVSVAALARAARLGVLDQVCYRYRRDRRGSLMEPSERHFDILTSYQEIISQRHSLAPGVYVSVFERAMWHYSTVLPLVPRRRRREFFGRIAADFRAWRPEGFRFPPGARGMKLRLIAAGRYRGYTLLEPVNRFRVFLTRRVRHP